jgi:hypothetical protein
MTKEVHSQDCPLCSNPAEFRFVDYENRKHFVCANCTEFQISVRAEIRVLKGPEGWKVELSKLAKGRPEGCTLVVTLPNAHQLENSPNQSLVDEYVKNSDLP